MSYLWQALLIIMRINLDISNSDVIIIPEQHLWHKNITSIPNMINDNLGIIEELYRIIDNAVNPTVILDGDIFHRGTPKIFDALPLIDYLHTLNEKCSGRLFSVVGNHEFTYHKDNLFWGFSDIQSNYVINRMGEPKTHTHYITVPKELKIGNSLFCFGHYDMDFYGELNTDGIDDVTLITHSCFGNPELFEMLKVKDPHLNTEVMTVNDIGRLGALPLTNKLKYIYVGHLHTCLGKFKVEECYNEHDYNCILTYLGSLGRTSHAEYNDNIERKIPIHKIRNGKLIEVCEEIIELPTRECSVDEVQVALNKEKYEEQKEIRELKSVKLQNVDIIQNVRDALADSTLLRIFDASMIGSMPDDMIEAIRRD